jgi:hypothetical protein
MTATGLASYQESQMTSLTRVVAVALVSFGLGSIGLAGTGQAQTSWDMPTPYPDGNFHTRNAAQFAADVDKATAGSLKIKIHSAGSLFKHPEIKRSVRQGTAPIGEILQSLAGNESRSMQRTRCRSSPPAMTPPRSCTTCRSPICRSSSIRKA